ncbi:HIT domain-containing protein [Candidatus Pelagibacter sp. HIMB1493]|uniref:HIT domain-containing protein n=1 Tax=Candidatus Pelagibacter sp. HIMB1493 TaxID=3413334 RepID=UPI003F848536
MSFKLDRKFLKTSHNLIDLKLCTIRLNDNSKFPWIILIPKRNKITDISDLNSKDQTLLMKEIVYVSKVMKKLFKTSKLNVEKIGNIVPQLHIHIIARSKNDSSWPLSVWVVKGKNYSKTALKVIVDKLRKALNKKR